MMGGDMKWHEIWVQMQEMNIQTGRGGGCWTTWQDETSARRYDERVRSRFTNTQRVTEVLEMVKPGWRVLDIGAGPGNLVIPLAQKVEHVTAIEPAAGMVTVLQEHVREHCMDNVTVIQKKWDDIDIHIDLTPPYDLSIASYSLGMVDLRAAIQKINAVTRELAVIYWHAGDQDWDYEAKKIWPIVHQTPYSPVPKSNIVFNVLYEMGIYADVKSYQFDVTTTYENLEDALLDYSARFEVGPDQHQAPLRKYIEQEYQRIDGKFQRSFQQSGMRFCWKPRSFRE